MNLEQSVCGLKEPLLFWLWSAAAGAPDADRLASLEGVEDVSLTTVDERRLRGYRLNARGSARRARGYLLVLQGNAILADQILAEFVPYARAGYDVYIYDYRGYGRSRGKRRLKAMISDAGQIIDRLNRDDYDEKLIYAFSFGGILLLNAYDNSMQLDRIVIDSSPSRLSDHGCPEAYDPVAQLPVDCSHFMFITGARDTVVTPAMSRELIQRARQCQARVLSEAELAHPFMERSPGAHERRMRLIRGFLLEGEGAQSQ